MGFELKQYTVSEGEGHATVCVNFTSTFERNITVHLSTKSVTAHG